MPRAWYCPQPQSENGESRPDLESDRPLPERAHRVPQRGSSRRTRTRASVAAANASAKRSTPAELERRVGRPQRRGEQRAELRPAGERDRRASRPGRGDEPEAEDEERGHDRVVRVRVQRVRGERVRGPREGEERREPARRRSAARRARAPSDGEQVERDGRRMRGGQRVPLPAPAEEERRRHVGEVRDGAVRVAALDRGLAAAVRLDALAHLPLGVLRAARLEVAALRHVPVRRLSVEDPARADDSGEADVDDAARRLEVEADAEAEEEDRGRGEDPRRPDRATARPRADRSPTQSPRASRYASTG